MKLIEAVKCEVKGTQLAAAGDLVRLVNIRGRIAIVSGQDGIKFSCLITVLICPMALDGTHQLPALEIPPVIQVPVKNVKKIINQVAPENTRVSSQTTLF